MSVSDFKRFTCSGCDGVLDCKNKDLLLPVPEGTHPRYATAPRGWVCFWAGANDLWRDIRSSVPPDDTYDFACSPGCAGKVLEDFARSVRDRFAE